LGCCLSSALFWPGNGGKHERAQGAVIIYKGGEDDLEKASIVFLFVLTNHIAYFL
jgi:hypothetical protein